MQDSDFRNIAISSKDEACDRVRQEVDTKYYNEKSYLDDGPDFKVSSYRVSMTARDQKRLIDADEVQRKLFKQMAQSLTEYVYGNGSRSQFINDHHNWEKAVKKLDEIRRGNA